MTSLFVVSVGETGKVICFEPQPDVRDALEQNADRWRRQGVKTEIDVRREALSSRSGTGHMARAASGQNRDGESLRDPSSVDPVDLFEVPLAQLDGVLGPETTIGVLKVDVERHELAVMLGGEDLLRRGAIRDIVFEEHAVYPTPVTNLLERHGYTLFKLDHSLFGPWVGPASSSRRAMTDQSFLATLAPDRAEARLSKRGWAMFPLRRAGMLEDHSPA